MPGSFTSVFGEPADFAAALRADGVVRVLISGRGQFRARLTRIVLHRLSLTSGEEELARAAVVVETPWLGSKTCSRPHRSAASMRTRIARCAAATHRRPSPRSPD